MAEEAQAVQTAQAAPAAGAAPEPKPKAQPKPAKVKVMLAGANSLNYEGVIYRKGDVTELDAQAAEILIQTGFFMRL